MRKYTITLLSAALVLAAGSAFSAINVLEGFETEDALNWQATSPANQTTNATNPASGVTPTFGTNHVTQGTKSGEFLATWALPGVTASGTNPHVSGGPLQFWSIRYNVSRFSAPKLGNPLESALFTELFDTVP